MKYSQSEIMQYIKEEDVSFIRLAFCDVFGVQKNISVMPDELPRAFEYGIAFDASAIAGFGDVVRSDLLLRPEPETLVPLPWRPEHGKVVQMFSSVMRPDGTPFAGDTRRMLKEAAADAKKAGIEFTFGAEEEFYLFLTDEQGRPTATPCDDAGYMDIAPEDRGENVRREICLTLHAMGIRPESSHHEEGPGQNEIDFRYSDALTAADNTLTFRRVVKTVAQRCGFAADFSPKPLEGGPGNGFHINISMREPYTEDQFSKMMAGILENVCDMTLFLNPCAASYRRLGQMKAPGYVSWSRENRSQLMRLPAAEGEFRRVELRSPDPCANPYLAFMLLIRAGLEGMEKGYRLAAPADINLYKASPEVLSGFRRLPGSYADAYRLAENSAFIGKYISPEILSAYGRREGLRERSPEQER